MKVKTFRARNMKQALELVRSELGPEAVIVRSEELSERRWFRRENFVEISAGLDLNPPPACDPHKESGLSHQLEQLHAMVRDLCQRKKSPAPDLPEPLGRLYAQLLDAEIAEPIASGIVCHIRDTMELRSLDPSAVFCRVQELIAGRIEQAGPIICRDGDCSVVALVGPTGVGKTSAIAKMAAQFKLRKNMRVGLITIDTYRIAAVDQLRTYADIIDVPMKAVMYPRDVPAALEEMKRERDLVLVDTMGRSPADEMRVKELSAFLQDMAPDETHLVLSATTSARGMINVAQRFAVLRPNRLLLTKLDEAACLGGLLGCLEYSGLPLSYVTFGQNVPDDIRLADAIALAGRIIESMEATRDDVLVAGRHDLAA